LTHLNVALEIGIPVI